MSTGGGGQFTDHCEYEGGDSSQITVSIGGDSSQITVSTGGRTVYRSL